MHKIGASTLSLDKLIEQRIDLMRSVAESLESSTLALAGNHTEAIARGAAHQTELCRQWSCLQDELQREALRRRSVSGAAPDDGWPQSQQSSRLHGEREALRLRIRYSVRVHCSLLRHLERSLNVVRRMVESRAPTYTARSTSRGSKTEIRVRE